MSLWDLTLRNVTRNFQLYTLYLFSMVAGVVIHFTFTSLLFNQDFIDALQNRQNFEIGVSIASFVVFLFILFFILFANSFFMRQRKKEFGMYLLLGLKERQITRMVFYETLILSAISLLTGIGLGGLLSKLFGRILMNLMRYNQEISLAYPLSAIASTAGLFFLLVLIITAQNHLMVHRVQLIELFHAKETSEKPVRVSAWLALLSLLLLGTAFFLISRGRGSAVWQDHSGISLLAVSVGIIGGTYLFFRQFAGWLLQRISRTKTYYEGNTMLWSSSLRFQIRSNNLNLTLISLFSTVIILMVCFFVINYSVQFKSVGRNLPNDIAFSPKDAAFTKEAEQLIRSSPHSVVNHRTLEALVTVPEGDLGAAFENPDYYLPELLLVSEQAYNDIVSMRGHTEKISLKGNEALSLAQGSDFAKRFEAGQEPELDAGIGGGAKESFRIAEKKDYALLGWTTDPFLSMQKKPAVLVIADETYKRLSAAAGKRIYEIYEISDAKNALELSKQLYSLGKDRTVYYSSFADVYSVQIEGSSLLLFSSSFLALIALIALASVIYFKQLREATEEQRQYAILRKLGVGSGEMKRVIRKQLLFVFFPPLLLGLLHSWFIINYYILETLQDFPETTKAVWGIVAAYTVIYALFYLSSTNLYYKIVSKKA
ncbi:FtsX-like permease family protein [Paenibacillus gansuensis]|uniref:FtsX-like permease family protein n=1 Tax=Paenibacillus gansuensis TaxID=306542 RepID=A0ABW5PKY6_9BACL